MERILSDLPPPPWLLQLRGHLAFCGEELVRQILSYLDPCFAYLVVTQDAQVLYWLGPGMYRMQCVHADTIASQLGGQGENGFDDCLDCALCSHNRLLVATRWGRLASIPLTEGRGMGTIHRQLERGVSDMCRNGSEVWMCLQNGTPLVMDDHLQNHRQASTPPTPWTAGWRIAVGAAVYTTCSHLSMVRGWDKSMDLRTVWPIPHAHPQEWGVVSLHCAPADVQGWDRLYLALHREVQIWEVTRYGETRNLLHTVHVHTRVRELWMSRTSESFLLARDGDPPDTLAGQVHDRLRMGGRGRKIWVSLVEIALLEQPGYQGTCHYHVDADAEAVEHHGQVVMAVPSTSRSRGGLLHHWRDLDVSATTLTLETLQLPVCILPIKIKCTHWTGGA